MEAYQISSPDQTYRPEEAASPMACLTRYQFCRASPESLPPGNARCGQLAGLWDALESAGPLFDIHMDLDEWYFEQKPTGNSKMASRFNWFARIIGELPAQQSIEILSALGYAALSSMKTLSYGQQYGASSISWKQDMTHLWNTWLACLQTGFVDAAGGIRLPELRPYGYGPMDQHMRDMCQNQKIQSRQHTSFSMFGLCFIFVAGTIIAIISYSLEPVFALLDQRRSQKLPEGCHRKDIEWINNESLHLQALAFQRDIRGQPGRWTGIKNEVPIMNPANSILHPLLFDTDTATKTTSVETKTNDVPSPATSAITPVAFSSHDAATAGTGNSTSMPVVLSSRRD